MDFPDHIPDKTAFNRILSGTSIDLINYISIISGDIMIR